MTIKYLNWFYDVNSVASTKFFIRSFSYYWIHVNWIYCFAFRMFIKHTSNSPEHVVHRLTKIFSSMSCDEDELTISYPFKLGMSIVLSNRMLHSINDGIASNIDFRRVFSLSHQIIRCHLSWSEVVLRDGSHSLAVKLFRIWRVDIICT